MDHLEPAVGVVQRLGPVYSLVFPVQSTIDTRSMVSLHIFTQNGRFFRPRFVVCVVMGSDWLMTCSNTFSDLLQHFRPIDTDVTKMLASDWLLFIAANQKPAFWCRSGYYISHTILLATYTNCLNNCKTWLKPCICDTRTSDS